MSNPIHQSQPPQAAVDQIIGLYNQGQLEQTVSLAESLANQYPNALILYDILGAAYMGLKNTEKTIASYQKALQLNSNHTDAYNNMGMALYDQGRFDEAVESYQNAVKLEPDFADAHYNLGNALKQTGELKQAIESYRASLAINPNDVEVLLSYGNALENYGNFGQAIEVYAELLKINPNSAAAQTNMDSAVEEQTELEKNVADYARVAKLEIGSAEVVRFAGSLIKAKGHLDAAINNYNKAIKIKPDYSEAYLNIGIVLKEKGELEAAIDSYKQAIKIKPDYADAYFNMGIALTDKGDLDAAINSYKQAIKIKPDYADPHFNMGKLLANKGELGEAIDSYKKALTIKPDYADVHYNLGFVLLNSGRLKEGFDEHEWRWLVPSFTSPNRNFRQPKWDGVEPLETKTILLWNEQGVGDVLTWSSCLQYLSSRVEHCIIECHAKLVPLLSRSFPDMDVRAENREFDSSRNDFDFHLPMGSLFRHFIPEISKYTGPKAFLVPDPIRVAFWKERMNLLGNGPFVGISWKSPAMDKARILHYTQVVDWAPIFKLKGIKLINLQSTDFKDDLTKFQEEFGIKVHHFDDLDHYDDLDDVAALCSALDIVVSVNTLVAPMAAGVGTPTKLVAWRHSFWNNILYSCSGPYVDVVARDTEEPWDEVFQSIAEQILKFR